MAEAIDSKVVACAGSLAVHAMACSIRSLMIDVKPASGVFSSIEFVGAFI